MTFDFRYPQINGATEKEQLMQMKTYMHQLVDQLKWALNSIETKQVNYIAPTTHRVSSNVSTANLDDDTTQVRFDELKPLIIKSAEIIDVYYEVINKRLEGLYVAQSDFGTYKEQTAQEIENNSTGITQMLTNVQTLETDLNDTKVGIGSSLESINEEVGVIDKDLQGVKAGVEGDIKDLSNEVGNLDTKIEDAKSALGSDLEKLKNSLDALNHTLIEVNAHIKSGLLYYDGEIPVYGLEVGQKNTINGVETFNKFARFCAGRLSFYDQYGTEVAYISDRKLYITHAEVTGTLRVGGYLIDTSNGVTFKWVGRS